ADPTGRRRHAGRDLGIDPFSVKGSAIRGVLISEGPWPTKAVAKMPPGERPNAATVHQGSPPNGPEPGGRPAEDQMSPHPRTHILPMQNLLSRFIGFAACGSLSAE